MQSQTASFGMRFEKRSMMYLSKKNSREELVKMKLLLGNILMAQITEVASHNEAIAW